MTMNKRNKKPLPRWRGTEATDYGTVCKNIAVSYRHVATGY